MGRLFLPWFAEFFALQRNGEGAAYHLKLFWECFCARNGFNLNGDFKRRGLSWHHYRPFTLRNHLRADALQEMPRIGKRGPGLFPAIPEEWKRREVAFEDFGGERGILISARYEAGRCVR